MVLLVFCRNEVKADDRYSVSTGLWSSTSVWSTTSGGVSGASIPGAGDNVYIEGGFTVTLDANTANLALLSIAAESILTTSGTFTVSATTININGNYEDGSEGAITVTSLNVDGTYTLSGLRNTMIRGSAVSNWNIGSTCVITGWISGTLGSTFDQTFYNFTWNCPGQTADVSFGGYVTTVNGTFALVSSGSSFLFLSGNSRFGYYSQTGGRCCSRDEIIIRNDFNISNGNFLQSRFNQCPLTVGGNFLMSGGIYYQSRHTGGSNATVSGNFFLSNGLYIISVIADGVLTVGGDIILSSGTLVLSQSEFGGVGTFNVTGNFTTGSNNSIRIVQTSTTPGSGNIVFMGPGTQIYTSRGLLSGEINFIVGNDTNRPLLQMGTGANPSIISSGSTGTFTLLDGASLGITSPDGIASSGTTGNIQVQGSRIFSTDANYIYNGAIAQISGNGLPSRINSLNINNAGGAVSFNAATAITNNFSIALGSKVDLGPGLVHSAGTMTLGGIGAQAGSWGGSNSSPDHTDDNYFEATSTGIVYAGNGTPGIWLGGATNNLNDWNTGANWFGGSVPVSGTDVFLPSYNTHQPVVSGTTSAACNDLTMSANTFLTLDPGGELTIGGNLLNNGSLVINSNGTGITGSLITTAYSQESIGTVTFNRSLRQEANTGDKHLFSSPVGSLPIPDFLAAYDNKVDALRVWNEEEGVWSEVATGTFESGKGYNVYQADGSDGDFSFTGSVVNSAAVIVTSPYRDPYSIRDEQTDGDPYGNVNHEADIWALPRSWTTNWGGGGWNLLGNPFTSAMNAETFITVNMGDGTSTNKFDPYYQALYVYDGVNGVYKYSAVSAPIQPEGAGSHGSVIQAGQGFMVMANNNEVQFEFTSAMQTHATNVVMLKSAGTENPWPGLHLRVRYGEKESATSIVYDDKMTTGLDPGYDVGQLSTGPAVEIYTVMAETDEGVNLARQALPITNADKIAVPVGIDTEKGGEVIFSAFTVELGNNNFWLEDRATGIFTDLATKSYTVTLPAKTYGVGRFYIIASTNTPTGIKDLATEDKGLRIWNAYDKIIIKGEISDISFCEIYDLRGKKIVDQQLTGGELNTVDLPAGIHGVYLVRVSDGLKAIVRKVAIL